ncbi:MAG TPA: Wzz/FepE/Etk N-terminal domain-containing protein [Solirubrobacterales bacterium]
MSIQTGERERARFDVPPPERDRGSGPTFGQALRRHWRVVVACVVGLAVLAIAYSMVRTPDYSAETRLAVGGLNATTPSAFTGFSTAAQQLAETDSRAVQGDAVVRDVAAALKTTPAEVRPHLSAAPIPQTPVFTVTATTKSAETSIDMSRLASEAIVREANRASDAAPGQLLKEYQTAERARQQAEAQVSPGTGSAADRANLVAAEAQADAARKRYTAAIQGGSVRLEIIQGPADASSDRLSKLQMLLFVAIVLGFIIGSAVAVFLANTRYPGFEETTLGRWELARRTRAQRARARRSRS